HADVWLSSQEEIDVHTRCSRSSPSLPIFFISRPATHDITTLSLHDALPISPARTSPPSDPLSSNTLAPVPLLLCTALRPLPPTLDRKSTRLKLQSRSDLVCRLLLEKKNLHQESLAAARD